MAGPVKSVQQIKVLIPAGSASASTPTLPVPLANSIIFPGGRNTDATGTLADSVAVQIAPVFSGGTITAISATRLSTTGNTTVFLTVVEFYPAVVNSIQYGTVSLPASSTSQPATISAVGANAFVIPLGAMLVSATAQTWGNSSAAIQLTNSTTVTAFGTGTNAISVGFVVVDLTSAVIDTVQSVSHTDATTSTSYSDTITSVDTTRSIAIYGGSMTTVNAAAQNMEHTVVIAGATTVTLTRSGGGANTRTVYYTVVQWKAAALFGAVQRGSVALAATTSNNAALSPSVPLGGAVPNWAGFTCAAAAVASDVPALALNSTGSQAVVTLNTAGTATVAFEVIEFAISAVSLLALKAGATPLAMVNAAARTLISLTVGGRAQRMANISAASLLSAKAGGLLTGTANVAGSSRIAARGAPALGYEYSAGLWDPRDAPRLLVWFCADDLADGPVTSWRDRVSGIVVTPPVATPVKSSTSFNGAYPGVTFDGVSGQYLEATVNLNALRLGGDPTDHFHAVDQQAPNSDQGSDGGGANSPAPRSIGGYGSDNTGTSRSIRRTRSSGDLVNRLVLHTAGGGNLGPDLANVFNGVHVVYGHFEPAMLTALFDGLATNPATGSASMSTIADRLRIGHAISNTGSPTELWWGVQRHFIIGVFSPADILRMVGWLMWNSGLQANLPANHPYKNAPPMAVSNAQANKVVQTTIAAKGRDAPQPVASAAGLSSLAVKTVVQRAALGNAAARSAIAVRARPGSAAIATGSGASQFSFKGRNAPLIDFLAAATVRIALSARAQPAAQTAAAARGRLAVATVAQVRGITLAAAMTLLRVVPKAAFKTIQRIVGHPRLVGNKVQPAVKGNVEQ